MDRDFYKILGVPLSADKEEIRQAYLRLARQYHPDMSPAPADRDLFEKINEAYTTLIDDESRFMYNLYGKEDEMREVLQGAPVWPRQKSWTRENALGVIFGLVGLVGLVVVGLLANRPVLEQELDTLAMTLQSKKAEFELAQKQMDQAPATSEKLEEASPTKATAEAGPQAAFLPSEAKLSTADLSPEVKEAIGTGSMSILEQALAPPVQPAQPVQPPSANSPARNYEVLAFYSLIIGDLNQFKNAIERASQEDPSYSKINALHLSFQQLESAKLPPESILKVLRGLVVREYQDRLLPSQRKILQSYAKNDEAEAPN
jgi:curved DNA-binding protein CbpA